MRALCAVLASLLACLFLAVTPARAVEMPALPPGISQAQYDWLLRLGAAKSPDETAAVLKERTDGPGILRTMVAGIPQFPAKIGSEWLAANPGLIVLAEQQADKDLSGVGLMGAGLVAHRNRRFEESMALYERARAVFMAVGDDKGVCRCCLHEASLRRANGDIAGWEAAAREAVRSADRTKDPQSIDDASFDLMQCLRAQQRYPEALSVMQEARALEEPLGNFRCKYDTTFDCILVLEDLHRYLEALPLAQKLAESTDRTGNAEIIWRAYSYWGYTLKTLRRCPESIAVFRKVITLLTPLGDEEDVALAIQQMADNSQLMGDSETASRYFHQSLPEMEKHIDDPGVAWQVAFALQYLSRTAIEQDRLEEALLDALAMHKAAMSSENLAWLLQQHQLMAYILERTGHLSESLVYRREAAALAEANRDRAVAMVPTLVLPIGATYEQMGDYGAARRAYEKALGAYLALRDDIGVDDSYRCLADIEVKDGHPDRALVDLDRAEQALERSPYPSDPNMQAEKWWIGYIRAKAYLALGRRPDALKQAEACRAASERTGIRLDAALALEAEVLERLGKTDEAISSYRRLIAFRQENPAKDPAWVGQQTDPAEANLVHLLLIGRKDVAGAFQVAQEVKGVSVRRFLLSDRSPDTSLPRAGAEQLQQLRRAYAEASQRASQPGASAARDDALTQLTTFEMSLRARYPRWGNAQARPASLDEIARYLSPSSAVLEMMVDQTHVSLLLLRNRNGRAVLTGHVVPMPKNTLAVWISQATAALQNPRSDPRITRQLLRRLYGYVIRPVEKDLAGVKTLVICPDRYLHAIPFAALEDAQGKYLIQKMALTVAPSASAWAACRTVAASHREAGPSTPVLAAVSRFGAKVEVASAFVPKRALRGDHVADLPGVVGESRIVEQAFHGHVVKLLEKEATVETVEEAVKHASVLHVATHAFANDAAPMLGSLLFSPSPKNPSGLLFARDVLQIPIHADLTVLSACETDEGLGTGEGLVGLAWAFMVAGCPSTIGSRWDVDDEAAKRWMAAFYRSYTSGKLSVAESRRKACLALLATKGARDDYSTPRFWANWALLGSDR